MQYSDLAEAERAQIFATFRQAVMRWNRQPMSQPLDAGNGEKEEKSHMIVVTDACLPLVNSGELPFNARVLINYELPTKKVRRQFLGRFGNLSSFWVLNQLPFLTVIM